MKHFSITCALVVLCLKSMGSHIVGGDIHYDIQADGTYAVTLTLFRDCSSNTEYDDPASIGVFNSDGDLVYNLEIPLSTAIVSDVPANTYNACFTAPTNLCVEQAIYSGIIPLQNIPGGYTITYQRCCRNFSIVNVPTGTDVGITLTTEIPGTEVAQLNSNPSFINYPPIAICLNQPFTFNHSATDLDGDSLVYEFCTPLNTNVNGNYINPPGAPPYPNLLYNGGYSYTYPLDASPAFTINPQTGWINGTPNMLGQFVVGICVSEYRNGVLINTTNRDFQFNITVCDPADSPAIASQSDPCPGSEVVFTNLSATGLTYFWDFGVTGIYSDTSNTYNASYNYVTPGYYNISLVLNPGLPCADTTTSIYYSSPALIPTIVDWNYDCSNSESYYSFDGSGGTTPQATYLWNFGSNATPLTSSSADPQNIFLGPAGSVDVSLTVTQEGCSETTTQTIDVPAQPNASIEPQTTFCDGYIYQFNNLSLNATNYSWDFGAPGLLDVSTVVNPGYTFPDTGTYMVRLIVTAPNLCPDTTYSPMDIYGKLTPYFDPQAGQCFEENTFNFFAQGATTNVATYEWSFGSNASIQTSIQQQVNNIEYGQPGGFEVTLTIAENDCLKSYSDSIFVYPNPQLSALVDSAIGCNEITAHFLDTSLSPTSVSCEWDFGDGTTSTSPIGNHTYSSPGNYDVAVHLWTSADCITSETFTYDNIVSVLMPPVAGYNISDGTVDLLEATIQFTDASQNALSVVYYLSDGTMVEDFDFSHTFTESGTFTIEQVVTDAAGCKSAVTGTVIVMGYAFFAPNSFTPDNDGLNDWWIPVSTGITEYSLQIYDRWGDLIFESNDQNEPWVGNVERGNHFAANGVYTYLIKAKDTTEYPFELVGHITLVR
jgi:gliding motility-associated-like protein